MNSLCKLVFLAFFFYACGPNELQKSANAPERIVAVAESTDCRGNFLYEPVCAEGFKDLDNKSISNCLGLKVLWVGKCDCDLASGEICGQPPMPECAAGMMCTQVMPLQKIFANECELKKANAQEVSIENCENRTI